VVNNGGSIPSINTQIALTSFMQTFYNNPTLYAKMISVNCFVPDNLIAAITPLFYTNGLDPWTNYNFVAGDLSVNGLKGNTSNKYLDTGVSPSPYSYEMTDTAGLTVYCVSPGSSGYGLLLGLAGAANASQFSLGSSGGGFFNAWRFVNVGQDNVSGVPGTGFISGNRTSATSIAIYGGSSNSPFTSSFGNGVAQSGAAITPSSTAYGASVTVYTYNNAQSSYVETPTCEAMLSFGALHRGLTTSEARALFNGVQALRQNLGGGYV
jgi:hypothetical protein